MSAFIFLFNEIEIKGAKAQKINKQCANSMAHGKNKISVSLDNLNSKYTVIIIVIVIKSKMFKARF